MQNILHLRRYRSYPSFVGNGGVSSAYLESIGFSRRNMWMSGERGIVIRITGKGRAA